MIIRDDILSASRLGAINIHHALLPRNRGATLLSGRLLMMKKKPE